MNRRKLERHLRNHGCEFHHHGGSHDIWWNPANEKQSSDPRHRTVKNGTAKAICRELEIPPPDGL